MWAAPPPGDGRLPEQQPYPSGDNNNYSAFDGPPQPQQWGQPSYGQADYPPPPASYYGGNQPPLDQMHPQPPPPQQHYGFDPAAWGTPRQEHIQPPPLPQHQQPPYGAPPPMHSMQQAGPAPMYPPPPMIPHEMISHPNGPQQPRKAHAHHTPGMPVFQQHAPQKTSSYLYSAHSPNIRRRKAVLIGINYVNSARALKGCGNDVVNMLYFLQTRFNFRQEDCYVLTDTSPKQLWPGGYSFHHAIPTRAGILQALQWLSSGTQNGDVLFFHYSGHGTQVMDWSGDETDGKDEAIVPCDYPRSKLIIDDQLFEYLVQPLAPGARLVSVMDSCHSGSGMDLPYSWSTRSGSWKRQGRTMKSTAGSMISNMLEGGAGRSVEGGLQGMYAMAMSARNTRNGKYGAGGRAAPPVRGFAVMFSGCQDSQTSLDTSMLAKVVSTGVMSYSFIKVVNELIDSMQGAPSGISFERLLRALETSVRNGGYRQYPQLSTSHTFDLRSTMLTV